MTTLAALAEATAANSSKLLLECLIDLKFYISNCIYIYIFDDLKKSNSVENLIDLLPVCKISLKFII